MDHLPLLMLAHEPSSRWPRGLQHRAATVPRSQTGEKIRTPEKEDGNRLTRAEPLEYRFSLATVLLGRPCVKASGVRLVEFLDITVAESTLSRGLLCHLLALLDVLECHLTPP